MKWFETGDQQSAAVAGWARQRGLAYARVGSLPPVSDLLQADPDKGGGTTRLSTDGSPGRWTENICEGDLPGGVRGQIGHHVYLYYTSETWHEQRATVTTATVLEGTRIARGFLGESHPPKEINLARREFGDEERAVGAPDGRFTWTIPTETDDGMFQSVFDARLTAALQRLPKNDRFLISQREGSLSVALINRFVSDPAELDLLCETTAALAAGMRRVAAAQRQLRPGDVVDPPRQSPYRVWAQEGAARVPWHHPPHTLDEAVNAYKQLAADDPAVKRRRRRGRLVLLAVFGIPGAIAGLAAGAAGGIALGVTAFLIMLLLGLGIGALAARSLAGSESSFRAEAWGLEAFAAQYASRRGYYPEDPQELAKRFTMPLFGSPQRAMRGELAPGVTGRIVLWRDRNEPTPLAFVNVALVPGALAPGTTPTPPFAAAQAGEWIVVHEKSSRQIRSAARLDALAAEAARLSAGRSGSTGSTRAHPAAPPPGALPG